MKKTTGFSVLFALLLPGLGAAAEYTFSVEPSYTPDRAQEVYRPLLVYLGKATGHSFNLVTHRNYHFLWRDVRTNVPVDFAFEEPHFVDYRAKRFGFVPLARLSEPSSYTLLADPEHAEAGLDGLIGRRVICMPSPSLGYALLTEIFKNPAAQPDIRSEAASWRDGVEIVFAGDAEAAMVPTFLAQQYPNLVAVTKSRDLSGAAVSAAPGVPEDVREAVREALLALHEDESLYEVLVEIGASQFETTSAADYANADRNLRGFFGYKEQ